jgi:hypothetical protein
MDRPIEHVLPEALELLRSAGIASAEPTILSRSNRLVLELPAQDLVAKVAPLVSLEAMRAELAVAAHVG